LAAPIGTLGAIDLLLGEIGVLGLTSVRSYAIPLRTRFRGISVREGLVVEGPAGWGEFCPFPEYDDAEATAWLAAAVEQATVGWPAPVRDAVPVNVIVPAVGPEQAHAAVVRSGCRTAKVKVADHPASLADDVARVEAVRDALGPGGAVRVDANGAWDIDAAVTAVRALDRDADGLQYVQQPCRTIDELAAVRRRVDVRIAADESIRRADAPLRVAVAGAADVAVLKCAPLGGVARALRVAEAAGLPCVVSSALETSVGLAAELALAAALPELEFACGLGTLALLDGDLTSREAGLHPVGGRLPVPRTPPVPDPALLDAHAMADGERARWWQHRFTRVAELLVLKNL
jgi:O-succinylbenzoate synthase